MSLEKDVKKIEKQISTSIEGFDLTNFRALIDKFDPDIRYKVAHSLSLIPAWSKDADLTEKAIALVDSYVSLGTDLADKVAVGLYSSCASTKRDPDIVESVGKVIEIYGLEKFRKLASSLEAKPAEELIFFGSMLATSKLQVTEEDKDPADKHLELVFQWSARPEIAYGIARSYWNTQRSEDTFEDALQELNRVYKTKEFKGIVGGLDAETAYSISMCVGSVASNIRSKAASQSFMEILGYSLSNPEFLKGLAESTSRLAIVLNPSKSLFNAPPELIKDPKRGQNIFNTYLEALNSEKFSAAVTNCVSDEPHFTGDLIGKVFAHTHDTDATKQLIGLAARDDYSSMLGLLHELSDKLDHVVIGSNKRNDLPLVKGYLGVCEVLDLSRFEESFYKECADAFAYLSSTGEYFAVLDTIKKEKEFFDKESPDILMPMAVILSKAEDKYHSHLKELDSYAKQQLSLAYEIARKNKNPEGNNYLADFYEGLNEVLKDGPAGVGKWAEAVVKGLANESYIDEGIERKAA